MGTLLVALLIGSVLNTGEPAAETQEILPQAEAEIAQEEYIITKNYMAEVTGYSSTPDQTDDTPFITANGASVHWGVIATNALPFNTKVRLPDLYGDKIFIVKDRMNKRYTNRLDIWFPERAQAEKFGIKNTTIEVIAKNPLYALAK